jgi:hypothetical protein
MHLEVKHLIAFVLKAGVASWILTIGEPNNQFTQWFMALVVAVVGVFLLFRQIRLLAEEVQSMPDDEGEGVEGIPDEIHLFGGPE